MQSTAGQFSTASALVGKTNMKVAFFKLKRCITALLNDIIV